MKIFIIMLSVVLFCSCQSDSVVEFQLDNITWKKHQSDALGIHLDYPENYTEKIDINENSVLFRTDGHPYLAVSLLSKADSAKRGLWASHQVKESKVIAGMAFDFYEYDHCDGIFCMRTLSYVKTQGDLFLAFEFRTRSDTEEAFQQHILSSITFTSG